MPELLLEREDELAAVGDLLADARAGRGRLLMLEAPPERGKSALAAGATGLADGFIVLRGSGHELEQKRRTRPRHTVAASAPTRRERLARRDPRSSRP